MILPKSSINTLITLKFRSPLVALCGGIDSTYLACKLKDKIDTSYTVGYASSDDSDEIDEAKQIAKSLVLKINL